MRMYTAEIVRRQQNEAMVRLSKQARALQPFYAELGKRWGALIGQMGLAPEQSTEPKE